MLFGDRIVGGDEALDAQVGTVLGGRYRILSTLGTGGMAVVYKAEDAILGRRVALKTLHERYAEEDSFRSRFKQEARAMASLDHENVVRVYDISGEGEVPFIVAEYVGGGDVGGMLRRAPGGRLDVRSVREIVGQLLRALAYAHRRGVIHRDIKPSNILLTEEGKVKVADFGIARIVEEEESAGDPGEIIGSARYMSPEQLRGDETTPRSDIYSVGILLYHCLTGRPPFSGDARSVARQQMHDDPTPPRDLKIAIPSHLEAVILKALSKDPGDRYPSASAMLEDLQRNLRESGSRADRGPRRVRLGGLRRGRARALVASGVLTLLLVLGIGTASSAGYVNLSSLTPGGGEEAAAPVQQPPALQAPEPPAEPGAGDESASGTASIPETTATQQAQVSVPVPNVNTMFDYYARDLLRSEGLRSRVVREYREGYAPAGVVWGTDPAVGTAVPEGTVVTVYATPRDEEQVPEVVLPDPSS
ncbi:protein kinase [Rubrobacter marinus]|uniref:non-specific serine/threonine protein kinase n=1 Tax=Rubrobacter marinus TaxID=2653852 RepID=A0A6G8PTT7_9ACTN|nr:protein kinase [Rubrobacter marinus]QIN77351.1 protein kinase [Rubrobacter marinus]